MTPEEVEARKFGEDLATLVTDSNAEAVDIIAALESLLASLHKFVAENLLEKVQ